MNNIEILSRIRELRDRCEDLQVRLRMPSRSGFVAAGLVKDAWQALGLAALDFHISVEYDKETSGAPASGTGIPFDGLDSDGSNVKEPSEKPGESNG